MRLGCTCHGPWRKLVLDGCDDDQEGKKEEKGKGKMAGLVGQLSRREEQKVSQAGGL